MAVNSYIIGQLVHLTAAFTVSTVATDPTAVTLTIKDPNGVITSPAAVHDGVGAFHFDFTAATPGTHYYTFTGTGTCQAAGQAAFDVAVGHTT